MLKVVLADCAHNPEAIIGRAIASWLRDKEVDTSLLKPLTLDALAFQLSDRHGRAWGQTYFGPWGSGTDINHNQLTAPPRAAITKEAIQHWRQRGRSLQHHTARARFLDAAWDLATLAGINRDRDDAILAIDSYIGQCASICSALHMERCLRRAHQIAKDCADTHRQTNARTSLLELCSLPDADSRRRLRFLACDLLLLDKTSGIDNGQKEAILNWMEAGLNQCSHDCDPFDGEMYYQRLDKYFRSRQDNESRQRIAQVFGSLLEAWASKGSGMLAMHNYKKAHKVYSSVGLTKEAKSVRKYVEVATEQSQDELSPLSTEIEIPETDLQTFVENIIKPNLADSIRSFVVNLMHRRADFERHLDTWINESTVFAIMPQTIMTESGDSVSLKSPAEDRESHLFSTGVQIFQFSRVFLRRSIDGLFVEHDLTPEVLVRFIDDSPIFQDSRRPIILRALKSYCMGDHIAFQHVGVTEIESALRALYQAATQQAATTTRDSKRWRRMTLSSILEDKAFADWLGEDFSFYLKAVLTHDLGLNMRNLLSHGLVTGLWCNQWRSDRLFHVVMLLATLVLRPETDGSSIDD
ncbi:MAG: DUF4209 domain-containing protein [Planctomycetota bacterium]